MPHPIQNHSATRAQLTAILGFSILYIIAATVFSLSQGNREFILYIVVMAVIMFSLMTLHRRVGLTSSLLWCLSFWGLLHMAGGLVPIPASFHDPDVSGVLYNLWFVHGYLKYDQVVHAYGFGITTWLCWQALKARMSVTEVVPRATPGLMILCAAGGIGFGAINEVIEFVATLSMPETNVGGYINTGWDLVSNVVGSTVTALIIYFGQKRDFRSR